MSRSIPLMKYLPWLRTQGVDVGMATREQSYWRCPSRECRKPVGPYRNPVEAKQDAMEHKRMAHIREPRTRGRSR